MTMSPLTRPKDTSVGTLLKGWRHLRRISQLELASKANSSARHISFIETGRSKPSQSMVIRLAEHLDVPVRDRNALLIAAGYAPAYSETSLDDPAMGTLRSGLNDLLTAYAPNPALIMDGAYNIVGANTGVQLLVGDVATELLNPPLNAIRLTLHPRGLAPRIHNLSEWRTHLLERVRRQIALVWSDELWALYEEVISFPAPEGDDASAPPPPESHAYALPMRIEVKGRVLSFISTVTTFNTPMDVTVSELAVETFLPADSESADLLQILIKEVMPTEAGQGSPSPS